MRDHYTIGDALVVLFENPFFYLAIIMIGFFIAAGFGGLK